MSEKILKIAGKRRTLLALIVMATFVLGIVFSGWLTPTPGKAQQGGGGSGTNNEATDCEVSSVSTNCSDGWVVLTNLVVSPGTNISIGNTVSASVTNLIFDSVEIIDTSYTNANPNATNPVCNDDITTNTPAPNIITNWWTVTGIGSFSGSGLSASFTPTCGNGTITFNEEYSVQTICETNATTNTISLSSSLNVLSLNIAGGNGIICSANSNNVAMVGQHINLSAQTCGGTFSNFQWSVPGYAISNYDVFHGILVTDFPLTNSSVSFYWVDGGAKSVSCSAKCGGITCSTNVTITVTRPTASMYQTDTPEWFAQGLALYRICLDLGNTPAVNDMGYSVLINSPIGGTAEYVQVINSYSINSSVVATGTLDTLVPYNGSPGIVANTDSTYPVGALLPFDDSPGAEWYYFSVALDAGFIDYIMYSPQIYGTQFAPLGGGTIFVPLGKINWSMNGGAHFSSPVSITITPAAHSGPSSPDGSTDFPSFYGTYAPSKP